MRLVKFHPFVRLVLVRHGQSRKNQAKGPFYKDEQERTKLHVTKDRLTPLTKEGRLQARKAGRGLKKLFGRFDRIYHSGFVRAKDTAAEIQSVFKPSQRATPESVIVRHSIRERNPGYLSDFTNDEVGDRFSWWDNYYYYSDKFLLTPIGGESLICMAEGRIQTFLRDLSQELNSVLASCSHSEYHDGEKEFRVLIVSHGRAIQCMRYILEELSYEAAEEMIEGKNPPNCSATSYIFDYSGKAVLDFENKVFK